MARAPIDLTSTPGNRSESAKALQTGITVPSPSKVKKIEPTKRFISVKPGSSPVAVAMLSSLTWERLATMADPRAMVMKALPRRDNHFSLAIEVKVESRMKTGDMYTIT